MKKRDMNRVSPLIETRQLYIETRVMPEFGNKLWVKVRLRNSRCSYCGAFDGRRGWAPSFHDLYHIVREIAECEELKYPQSAGYKGGQMVLEFLTDCLAPGADWPQLKQKHKIPDREGEGI